MQLIIKKLTGATIESNISELDTYMQETKKRYENWIVIESEIKNAKEERALLNKLEKELSDTRKKVQKEGLASIDNFIDKLKESEKEITETMSCSTNAGAGDSRTGVCDRSGFTGGRCPPSPLPGDSIPGPSIVDKPALRARGDVVGRHR